MSDTPLSIAGIEIMGNNIVDDNNSDTDIERPTTPVSAYRSTNNLVNIQTTYDDTAHDPDKIHVKHREDTIVLMTTMRGITDALSHTFILSIFETIFFWTYISVQEDNAMRRNLYHLQDIITELCKESDISNSLLVEDSIEIDSRPRDEHNEGLFYTSIFLSLMFMGSVLAGSIICAMIPNTDKDSSCNKKLQPSRFYSRCGYECIRSLSSSILPITVISIYEVLFFQTVVKLYIPMSPEEIYAGLFDKCI